MTFLCVLRIKIARFGVIFNELCWLWEFGDVLDLYANKQSDVKTNYKQILDLFYFVNTADI